MRNHILFGLFVSVSIFASVIAVPAHAVSKKELEAQNIQLMQRLTALENRMLTGDPAAERLMQRMDALEATQRSLTGEIERLRYERDSLQQEVQALASQIVGMQALSEDIKRHLKAVQVVANETSASPRAPITYGGGVPTQQGNDITKLAEIGQEQMLEGNIGGAQTSFLQYLELNPNAADRGDIYYWLGETYYVKGGYPQAVDAYVQSMSLAPKGPYAPDSMIKLAATASALGNKEMACKTLASFPAQYPNASASAKDKARIERDRAGC
ncbi:MAG: tetratricopeptide repeat protein [Robiginitomaculum sp.]